MTLTKTLIILDITKTNLIIVLLYVVCSKQLRTNAASHRTRFDIALGNPTLHVQPTHK